MCGRGSESVRHVGLGCLMLVPAKETLMCCQRSGKTDPGLRSRVGTCLRSQGEVRCPGPLSGVFGTVPEVIAPSRETVWEN